MDGSVRVWDAKLGTCVAILEGHSESVMSVAYSPDGGNIASGSWDNSVKVWDVMSGVITATLKHSNHVDSVTYSPDGKYIASGSWDKTVKVWDAMSGAITATLKGHSDKVNSVAYSPDGQYIASWSDNSVKVWDVSNLLPQAGGKKNKTTKKEKLIDTYKKSELVKIANMNDVSLKMRNDKAKTKLQLFNSLKRKKLL
jgi:WD40 repeat protein